MLDLVDAFVEQFLAPSTCRFDGMRLARRLLVQFSWCLFRWIVYLRSAPCVEGHDLSHVFVPLEGGWLGRNTYGTRSYFTMPCQGNCWYSLRVGSSLHSDFLFIVVVVVCVVRSGFIVYIPYTACGRNAQPRVGLLIVAFAACLRSCSVLGWFRRARAPLKLEDCMFVLELGVLGLRLDQWRCVPSWAHLVPVVFLAQCKLCFPPPTVPTLCSVALSVNGGAVSGAHRSLRTFAFLGVGPLSRYIMVAQSDLACPPVGLPGARMVNHELRLLC